MAARARLAESGMLEFEACLSDFLEKENARFTWSALVRVLTGHGKRLEETIEADSRTQGQ